MTVRPIKGFEAFSDAYRSGRRVSAGVLLLSVTLRSRTSLVVEPDVVLIGVTVSKRMAKKAVVRSRIRRLLREALRFSIREHAVEIERATIATIVAIVRSAPSHPALISLEDIQPLVEQLLLRVLGECNTPSTDDRP